MRDLTPETIAELRQRELEPILLFEGDFAGIAVRLWTGYGALFWGGHEWDGVGLLLGVTPIEEAAEARNVGFSVSLSGVPPESIALAISEAAQGRRASVWLGLLDAQGAVVPEPILIGAGRLDVPAIDEGEDTATITITYESDLVDLERPRGGRYTHESQQTLFRGDRGLEYVAGLQDRQIVWGRKG